MRRKVLIVTVLVLAMLLQSVVPFTTAYAATSVAITLNSKLYSAVKEDLQRQGITAEYKDANGIIVISESELERVTELNLENKEIDDLTGLDSFKNVTKLNLHANELTTESNLSVLDGLKLNDLDLSSNKLESVKSISSFKDIKNPDITNQKVTGRQIISVNVSEEIEERPTTIEVNLPDILLEDGNRIDPNWIEKSTIKSGSTGPDIDYAKSFAKGSTVLTLKVATGTGEGYKALKGLVKLEINVKDSKSKLANSQMEFYYVVVDQDETGIAFEDENLYKAVKDQLTDKQKINKELLTYNTGASRNLYERAYDEALILVIKTDDVINNIPSLILNDKYIEDLTGLEQFVGLKSYLNLSYNYIDSVERIVELEQNKVSKEEELRARYQAILTELKANTEEYDKQQEAVKQADEKMKTAQEQIKNIQDATQKAAKQTEIAGYAQEKANAENAAKRSLTLIKKYTARLYQIYKYEYKLVSLLPVDVNYLSYKDLLETNLEQAKEYSTKIMDKISKLEKGKALTVYEDWAIKKLMGEWAKDNGLTFETTKKAYTVQENGETSETSAPIDYPISEFFETVKQDKLLSITDFQQFIYIYKAIDTLSQIENYSVIKRVSESKSDSVDYAEEALNYIKNLLTEQGRDTYFYEIVKKSSSITSDRENCFDSSCGAGQKNDTEGYMFDSKGNIFNVKIGLGKHEYSGTVDDSEKGDAYILRLAHRQSLVEQEDIDAYIVLPRIQKLNLEDNKIGFGSGMAGLETLKELKELNLYKNGLNDITTNIDWTALNQLKVLNLGYNQISNIEPLEVLVTLEELNVSNNLLSGAFTFNLINMTDLRKADFSHNQYNDIDYANDQYILKAKGVDTDGDGVSDGVTVPEYLQREDITLSFQYQMLDMDLTIVKTNDEFIEVDLPLIFRQLEKMDNERTSFGDTSIDGLVDAKGEKVKLYIRGIGSFDGYVTVDGRNGFDEGGKNYTIEGIGFGTVCKIKYNVVESTLPDDTNNPGSSVTPQNPGAPEQYGYDINNNYVFVYQPETTLNDFASKLVNTNQYNVSVTDNKSTENIGTGSVVTVSSKTDDTVYGMFETVVKGDLNGDGEVDALDSGVIRQVIADITSLVGVYNSAADVNNDGDIDSQDSMLILQYRADRITGFEK